jgi:RNA polymerase sigma-70 factor, ECF subfamily
LFVFTPFVPIDSAHSNHSVDAFFRLTHAKPHAKFLTSTVPLFRTLAVQAAKKGEGNAMLAMEVQSNANSLGGLPPITGSPDLPDERWLIASAKSGHQDAFGELYQRHRLRAYRMAFRTLRNQQDAEDAVQRAFHRALVNLHRFREDSTFSTWLTRIVINEALMLLRQRRAPAPLRENHVDAAQGDRAVDFADHGPSPEEILCESERRAALLQAIGRLRKSLRIVVLYREFKGLTSVETARLLGLTVTAVKARTFHARTILRKHLERTLKSKLQARKA